MPTIQSCTFKVGGPHCRSCELLIEKEISRLPGVQSVEAKAAAGSVQVSYSGQAPTASHLNQLFKDNNYVFSQNDLKVAPLASTKPLISLTLALLILSAYYLMKFTGVFSVITVDANSYLPAFLGFGLLAGLSTCAALVGSIVLSLTRQWSLLYASSDNIVFRSQPVVLFILGRLLSFTVFGALLGAIGSFFRLSITAGSLISITVSFLTIILALQMIGVPFFRDLSFGVPKFFTRRISDEAGFKGKYMPFIMGFFTFFLPCGFTLTAQSLALASGNLTQGALILSFFCLGTTLPLLAIGISSAHLITTRRYSGYFSQTAGLIVLLFSLYTIVAQFSVLGFDFIPTFLNFTPAVTANDTLPPVVNDKQVIYMEASATGYKPSRLKVKAGIPVRWEITDTGTSGCTNAIISPKLFYGPINLVPGTTSVREFTPKTPGTYRFSCWMGMVNGTIEVIN